MPEEKVMLSNNRETLFASNIIYDHAEIARRVATLRDKCESLLAATTASAGSVAKGSEMLEDFIGTVKRIAGIESNSISPLNNN